MLHVLAGEEQSKRNGTQELDSTGAQRDRTQNQAAHHGYFSFSLNCLGACACGSPSRTTIFHHSPSKGNEWAVTLE